MRTLDELLSLPFDAEMTCEESVLVMEYTVDSGYQSDDLGGDW